MNHCKLRKSNKAFQDLGIRFDEASTIINALGYIDVLIINKSYPSLTQMLMFAYNIKTTAPTFYIEWFEQYKQELNESKGLIFGRRAYLLQYNHKSYTS